MRSLVIKCTAGADDPERCNQAFTVAAAGVAAGAQVSLWLTGEAAWFGVPGRAEAFELELATPLAELRDIVLATAPSRSAASAPNAAASSRATCSKEPESPEPPSSPKKHSPKQPRPSSTSD